MDSSNFVHTYISDEMQLRDKSNSVREIHVALEILGLGPPNLSALWEGGLGTSSKSFGVIFNFVSTGDFLG